MNRCRESRLVQDYLDRVLEPAATATFRAHLVDCADCAAELALYRRVFDVLAATPGWDPGPALTERVLAHVLPSRVRRHRRLVALGWGYAGGLTAMLAGLGLWGVRPGSVHALEALSGEASRRLIQTGLFVLNALTHASLRIAEGWACSPRPGRSSRPCSARSRRSCRSLPSRSRSGRRRRCAWRSCGG
jgi:hypothetical protein